MESDPMRYTMQTDTGLFWTPRLKVPPDDSTAAASRQLGRLYSEYVEGVVRHHVPFFLRPRKVHQTSVRQSGYFLLSPPSHDVS
jgi:hypothetical protein